MNTARLYRPSRRWLVWVAFTFAAGIHVGAIVVAQGKSDRSPTQDFTPAGVDIEMIDQDQQRPPDEAVVSPPSDQVPPDQDAFPEENRVLPVRPHRKTVAAAVVRPSVKAAVASFGLVKELAVYAPRAVYPYEARRQRVTGSGIALLMVAPDGSVVDVRMVQSSGSAILNNATI